jgi:hypothetical protein
MQAGQGLAGQLGGLSSLAGLAGIPLRGGDSAEPLAVLRSRDLSRAFIEEEKLLPVLFADRWDAQAGRWKSSDAADQPDIRDAVKYFNEEVRSVQEDKKTGLVMLNIEWLDAPTAARWANLLVARANDVMRSRAVAEAQRNIAFLQSELKSATVVSLQQSTGRLLDRELETLMLARGKPEFVFRVVDPAEIPKERSKPKRAQTVGFAALLGLALGGLLIVLRYRMKAGRGSTQVRPAA